MFALQKGTNRIELHFFDETVDFMLHYRVPKIRKYVRPIYIKPCNDEGCFQVSFWADRGCMQSCVSVVDVVVGTPWGCQDLQLRRGGGFSSEWATGPEVLLCDSRDHKTRSAFMLSQCILVEDFPKCSPA